MTRSREEFTVQVLTNGSGAPAGIGFVVDETHVVTCAHVVNTALKRKKLEQDPPDPGTLIRVALPMLDRDDAAPTFNCLVQKWVPPPKSGVSGGDVAGLALAGDEFPELARAAWLADYRDFRNAEAKVFGYPGNPPGRKNGGWATVRVSGRVGERMIQLDVSSESAFLVQPGYSGSPVVVTNADGHDLVVGMLSAAGPDGAKDALAIPAAELALAWPEVIARLSIRECPYRGLKAFTADDADVFVGREDDIAGLRDMVRRRALTMVTGPSGVGKSSLVDAGLIPRLTAEGWAAGRLRPGREREPVDALARALASVEAGRNPTVDELDKWTARILAMGLDKAGARLALALGQPVVLHADQLEEVLDPQVCEPDVRARFLELLLSARSAADEGLHLVGTVRADFLAQLLQHPDAGTRLVGGWFGLSPMGTDRLETVITEPARKRSVDYEDGLAEVIARDAGNGPALPLLEFTLTQLWEQKRGRKISHAAYQAIGGVAGALSGYAENSLKDEPLNQFPVEQIRRVLLALVRSRGGAADATRRVVSRDRLGAGWDIAQALASYRLVTIGRDDSGSETAEIAHEALIREWPTLRAWVNNDSDFQRWLSMAEERAADGELLPDTRLAEADRWLAERVGDIPPEVGQLIQDSKSEWHRRVTELEDARNRAEARRLAAAAELALISRGVPLQVSLALAIEALRMAPLFETDTAVRHVTRVAARQLSRLDHDRGVHAVAFSGDGTRVATAGNDHSSRVFHALTGTEISRLDHDQPVYAVAFSPDATRVATASGPLGSDGGSSSMRVFDAATGTEISRLDHDNTVWAVAFSPDGTRVTAASWGNCALVCDAATGAEICRLNHQGGVTAVAFSPDGRRVATAGFDGSARVFDAVAGTEISRLGHDDAVRGVAFSPDGRRVATASDDGSARVFDAVAGTEICRLDHDDTVSALAFSPDGTGIAIRVVGGLDMVNQRGNAVAFSPGGTRVVAASWGSCARVFNAETGSEVSHLNHYGDVHAVAFSPDGTCVATASADGSARVFDAAAGTEISRLDHDDAVRGVVFSPDGSCVATASDDGSARVFDTATSTEISGIEHAGAVTAVVFSPGGTCVATASDDGSARVFDAAAGTEISRLGHDDAVRGVAFSPDGRRVATASDDGTARVLDAATGAEISRLNHHGRVRAVAFSRDGTRMITAGGTGGGGSARVFDAVTGAEICRMEDQGDVTAIAFSPDGTRAVAATGNIISAVISGFLLRMFDTATGEEIWRLNHGGGDVTAVAFSPDGARVAGGAKRLLDGGGSVGVFDTATGAVAWSVDHDKAVTAVAFSPDGTRVVSATDHGDAFHSEDPSARGRVFDAATGAEICHFDHQDAIHAAVFSPDGTCVATGSTDGTAAVFDAATGEKICQLEHSGVVHAVAFSPDGASLATGCSDGYARIWITEPGKLIEQAESRVTRNLTEQEWRRYFGGEPYRKTRAHLPVPAGSGPSRAQRLAGSWLRGPAACSPSRTWAPG